MRSLLLITFLSLSIPAAADQVDAPEQFFEVREQIQAFIDDGDSPAVSVAVVQNDRLIWAEGFGYANLETKTPASADTIYRLASISKSFTGTGLMVLVDRGSIDLDASANQYLTGEKLRAYVGSADEITVRKLANHTSGLPLHWNFFYPGHQPPNFDLTLRRFGFAYRKPGTFWEYSNLAYGVLDRITANAAGKSWSQFMQQEVYTPLGMTRTSDHIIDHYKSDAATQYARDIAGKFSPVPHYDFDHPGASAVVSSANDMARYARMHLNNGRLDGIRVLSEEAAFEMRQPTAFSPARNLGYGVAFNDGMFLGQQSNSSSGGMPGVSTTVRLFPADRSAIVVLTNTSDHNVTTSVMTAIAKQLYPTAAEAETADNEQPENGDDQSLKFEPFLGNWTGKVIRHGEEIPVTVRIKNSAAATLSFDGGETRTLIELSVADQQFVGKTTGKLVVDHAYQGESEIYLRLHRDGNRLVGRMTAIASAYFALSHWIALEPEPSP
jgi:CubicO group peptidase (beta-lactamase class C family)